MEVRWLLLSVVLVAGILAIPYRWLVEHAYLLYGLGIFALVAVLVIGKTKNGSTRWFSLGVMDLQPSEFINDVTADKVHFVHNDRKIPVP